MGNSAYASLPQRTENGTVVFPELNEPQSYTIARTSAAALGVPVLIFNLVVLYLLVRKCLHERKLGQAQGTKLRLILIGNLVFSSFLLSTQAVAAPWKHMRWEVCTYFGSIYAFFYLLTNFFVYLMLYERAKVVASMNNRSKRKRALWFILKVGIYSVPLLALSVFALFGGKLYFKEQTCVQSVNPLIGWLSLMMDTFLSLGLLYLFLDPLLSVRRLLKNDPVPNTQVAVLENVTRQAFVLSFVAIFSTLVYLVAVCTSTTYLQQHESPDISWLRHVQSNGINAELFINSCVILIIGGKSWMPAWLYEKVNRLTRSRAETNDGKGITHTLSDGGPAKASAPTSLNPVPTTRFYGSSDIEEGPEVRQPPL